MYWIKRFGSVNIPKWNPSHFTGTGSASNFTLMPLAGGGAWDSLGSGTARVQGVQIQVQAEISISGQTADELETQERALRGLVGRTDQLWRQWDASGEWEWCQARCISVGSSRSRMGPGDELWQTVPIVFQMLSPAWYSAAETDITVLDPIGGDEEIAVCGAQGSGYPIILYVEYDGDAEQPEVTITITAGDGAVTAVSLSNSLTGHSLTWAGTLAAGKSLVIDCGAETVENDGTADYDGLTPPTDKDAWMSLEVGMNPLSINITEAGTESTIEVEYYELHP